MGSEVDGPVDETIDLRDRRDPIKNLVYSEQAADLHDVMVDGRWLMRDRVVLSVDEIVEVCSG